MLSFREPHCGGDRRKIFLVPTQELKEQLPRTTAFEIMLTNILIAMRVCV